MNAKAITINLTHLKSIIGDDNEFVVEILEMIRLQSPEVVSTMEVQLENKDYKALGATAHKYKSSINVLGNPLLSGIIRNIENTATDAADKTLLPDMVQEFRQTCDVLLKEIQNELNRLH
ncbi:MAG: Hpt domain-containing protein [Bacteroidia bacterium]|nr:Hpt domain-containing protein [Bacteroidia bacterium]